MAIDWEAVDKAMSPIKGYADACARLRKSYAFPFVEAAFNLSLPALAEYIRLGVGSDPRERYTGYAVSLLKALENLGQAGAQDLVGLLEQTGNREKLAHFCGERGALALDAAAVLKFLVYWLVPMEKYLSGLIPGDPELRAQGQALSEAGIRTNLEVLEGGRTPAGRLALVQMSGLPLAVVRAWVQRADLSRMPWASKATIANLMGSGYGSLDRLARADPERLTVDYMAYGRSIGKDLRLGNEIENSQRFARLLPRVVEEDP